MSYFDIFMGITLLEDIFGGLKDMATDPDTAKWFWGIIVALIVIYCCPVKKDKIIYSLQI